MRGSADQQPLGRRMGRGRPVSGRTARLGWWRCAAAPHSHRPISQGAADEAGNEAVQNSPAALLPADLLQPGEIILLLIKPSPWFIVLVPLRLLVGLALLTLAAVTASRVLGSPLGLVERDVVLLGIGAIGLRLFWQFLEWLSRTYVLTDQRIIQVSGVLTVRIFETRLTQIQHSDLIFLLRERLFFLGTIRFATAGTAWTEVTWQMVARPMEVHQRVLEALRRYRR